MRVLDLFAGLGGWSAPFAERGHEVLTLDADPRFGCDVTADILEWDPRSLPWRPDVVLASPPCEAFSTGGFHQHAFRMYGDKTKGTAYYEPASEKGALAVELVERTVRVIGQLEPRVAVIENPRALLRQLGLIQAPRTTVWYCHYGEARAKPTDLWGMPFPAAFRPEPECHNLSASHPADCCCHDHNPAPRGSVTGTQGMSTAEAARVPAPLALAVCDAAELDPK